ncbi:MAG TPA: lysoplasmalogenase [Myxococcota bacterium]|nr:lysoplasmalogenase [Myxococcota bacterium]
MISIATAGQLAAPPIACAVAVALLLRAEARGSQRGVWIWKPLAAASFLAAAWLWGAPASEYGRRILLGLALCACGDVFLIPRSDTSFRLGLVAFLCGHLAYAAAFLTLPVALQVLVPAAIAIALALWRVWRWLAPHLPARERVPVSAYFAAIGAMGALSICAVAAGAPVAAALGALGFMASDVSVARERFAAKGFRNAAWGLPLYFASQLLLAWSSAGTTP